MTKKFSIILLFAFSVKLGFSQDSTSSVSEPVRDIFNATTLIDNQTVTSPLKGSKQLIIQHRFSKIDNISDLYGIYGSSNIRLAFNYGITDKLMAGFGTEMVNKLQEFYWKYNILTQKTSGMPFSLSYFGNITIDGRNKANYGDGYEFQDRLSYFTQLILARKFNDYISLEVAGNYSHFNKVDSLYRNDSWGITFGGRIKIYNEISFLFEYDYCHWLPFAKNYQINTTPQPDYAFGFEIGTSTHAFQLFATTCDRLNPQENFTFNQKKFDDLMLGFNITVKL